MERDRSLDSPAAESIGVTRHVGVSRGETSLERPAAVPQGDWCRGLWAFGDGIQSRLVQILPQRNVEVSGLFNSFHGVRIDSGSKARSGPKTSGPSDSTG